MEHPAHGSPFGARLPFEEAREIVGSRPAAGPWQMAADLAILSAAPPMPVFRFYRWDSPQITFGRSGNYPELAKKFPGWKLTRRPTGGGVVFHGEDITYSLVVPARHPMGRLRGTDFYRVLHEQVAGAMRDAGCDVWLSPGAPPNAGGECFATPVRDDVLHGTSKVAGGALRRTRDGLLYQGSINLAPSLGSHGASPCPVISHRTRALLVEKLRGRLAKRIHPQHFSREELAEAAVREKMFADPSSKAGI